MASVLVVEDYESIKDLYYKAFTAAGYETATAGSGAEALRMVADKHFDVIVLDMLMLELSGLDFLRQFALTKDAASTKIVVVTNLDSQNIMNEALTLGVDKYLLKAHYTPQQIVAEAAAVLGV